MENDYTIRRLIESDLFTVAKIHKNAFADSALSKLGLEPIRRYYEWQLTGPHDCYAIGAFDETDELLGFCFSGVFRGALSGFLNNNLKFLFSWIILHPWLIFNPLVTDRIKMAFKIKKIAANALPSDLKQVKTKSFGVLSIAVDPQIQGKGVGKLLMDAVEVEAKTKGFEQLHLTVHPANTQAVEFYLRCGWNKWSSECVVWNGLMVKPL